MLTFKTQFPLNSVKTLPDLLEAGRIWIAGSPHYSLAPKLANPGTIGDGWSAHDKNSSVSFALRQDSGHCGLRFENKDDKEIKWITEIIGYKAGDIFWVAVQINSSSDIPRDSVFLGNKPYIIKVLMEKIGGGCDALINVTDFPHYLDSDHLDTVVDIMNGQSPFQIPVAYVSVDNQNMTALDTIKLARRLSGMAHVLVEPSRKFSFELRRRVDDRNAYGGAIAIYWPGTPSRTLFLPNRQFADKQQAQEAIFERVRLSLFTQTTKYGCTWSNLQEQKAKKKIRELKELDSEKLNEYIELADQELQSKDEEIARLEEQIARMQEKFYSDDLAETGHRRSLVLHGNESDLYQGEIINIIMDMIERELKGMDENSRRRIVLEDLFEVNKTSQQSERDEIILEVKRLLKDYRSMTGKLKNDLEAVGFDIKEDGNHYKMYFRGERRCPVVLPKSGSDHRGGMNNISALKRQIF